MDRTLLPDAPALDEALVASAHVEHQLAVEHCPHALGGDCTWYHRVWQYLRALGLVKNAGGHALFLHDNLRALAEQESARRVLISGSADDAMALLAIKAFGEVQLELTAIDRCETPLALSRRSAVHAGAAVTTRCIDVLDFTTEKPFDVVITNSFLSYIEPAARPRLFARWASLLRRGGKVLFTNRLRPSVSAAQIGFTIDEARTFCAAARAQAERYRNALALDPETLEGWARDYATRIRPFPVRSVDEIIALLQDAGFAPDRVDTAPFAGMSGGVAIAGPTVADRAEFVRVLATRR